MPRWTITYSRCTDNELQITCSYRNQRNDKLTDSWYLISLVQTSSFPITHGISSVFPFSFCNAWWLQNRSIRYAHISCIGTSETVFHLLQFWSLFTALSEPQNGLILHLHSCTREGLEPAEKQNQQTCCCSSTLLSLATKITSLSISNFYKEE